MLIIFHKFIDLKTIMAQMLHFISIKFAGQKITIRMFSLIFANYMNKGGTILKLKNNH